MVQFRQLLCRHPFASGAAFLFIIAFSYNKWPLLDINNEASLGFTGAIIGGVCSIVGSWLAWHLAERSKSESQKQDETEQRKRVLILLSAEIEHNLSTFRTFWHPISEKYSNANKDGTGAHRIIAQEARKSAWLPMSYTAFESLMPQLPVAIDAAKTLRAVFALYSKLRIFTATLDECKSSAKGDENNDIFAQRLLQLAKAIEDSPNLLAKYQALLSDVNQQDGVQEKHRENQPQPVHANGAHQH